MQARRRREREVVFDILKVFPPGLTKVEDLELEFEVARYRARQGQAGTRGRRGPEAPCPGCYHPLWACTCSGLWARN